MIPPGFRFRRSSSVAAAQPPSPLVTESLSWQHGVFLASTLSSETTAASTGTVGVVRRDPMAMLPFLRLPRRRLLRHWLDIGTKTDPHRLPKIFYVNWFRRGDDDEFLWPGFGENCRILKWALQRIDGRATANPTPIGNVPRVADLDLTGLKFDRAKIVAALNFSPEEWLAETSLIDEWYATIGTNTIPDALRAELAALKQHLSWCCWG